MKVSLNWLQRWVDLTDVDPDELAGRLTMAGLEVEGIERIGEGHDQIVVGRIDSIEEHPSADRLVLCRVDAGGSELRQIACGATNMSAGDLVPVALPGSQPPGIDFGIEAREVAGVMSEGMLCAADELGLADESEGLMILEGDYTPGQPFFEALRLKDIVLHLGLTPNRSDCQSHLGVAREIAALYGRELDSTNLPAGSLAGGDGGGDVAEVASLAVEDTEGCPRYALAVLENIAVGPSPEWLVRHLAAIGVRSVNNVVDVTNFILQDIGQPLHAFDLDRLAGNRIVVRRAREGEKLVGINHREYELQPGDLVIADDEKPVAIAGVMGGKDTEVDEETTRILIECAYFDPTTVRKTSKRHGLHTESSHRFERGVDPEAILRNLGRAVQLMHEAHEHLDGAAPVVRSGNIESYPDPVEPAVIDLTVDLVERVLGVEISAEAIRRHLESIGLEVETVSGVLRVTVPTFRPDLERPIDLVEEVARLYGYDRFEPTLPGTHMGREHLRRETPRHDETIVSRQTQRRLRRVRDFLLSQGLYEAVNYSFMSTEQLDRIRLPEADPRRDAPHVSNPLTQDQEWMRTTMIPGLLGTLETNLARRIQDVALFERGRCYTPDGERRSLAILVTGSVRDHFSENRSWDFYDVKGMVESMAIPFETEDLTWISSSEEPYLHPGVQARWGNDEETIARVGQLHPRVVQDLEIETPVFIAELEMDALLRLGAREKEFEALPKYPSVRRDFAFLYERDAAYGELRRAVDALAEEEQAFGSIFESVKVFDLYEGEQVPEGKRSLAMEITYRSPERTLTDEEVSRADEALIRWLEEEVGATLR